MRLTLSISLVLFCVSGLQAQSTVLLTEDFEDNVVNYTTSTPEFHDGTSDYFTITPLNGVANSIDAYSGFGGSNYFAVEDMDDGNSRPGSGTLSFNVNVAGFENLSLDMLFAAGGNGAGVPAYDSDDGFLVRASIDGNPFQNLLAFEAAGTTNQLLLQDTNFDGTGDGFQPSESFTAFNGLAIAGTGSNLLLEIVVDSNDGNVEFAFDNIVVSGTSAVPEPGSAVLLIGAALGLITQRRRNQKSIPGSF